MRALPFLGSRGNFNFWKEADRQKHLFSIFYALDASKLNIVTVTDSVADAAYNLPAYATLPTTVVYTIIFATHTDTDATYAIKLNINLEWVILQDIKALEKYIQPTISIATYKEVWNNFQTALKNEGCEYWADW